jgi:DNA-binding transcriptional LysR family regulator
METINLADLRVFLAVARHGALAPAADELHLTPSAVSKALRRLEQSLETPLFERGARQLLLNAHGARLVASGQALLAQAARTRADLLGERASIACRVAGPAVLLWRHAGALASGLRAYPGATIGMQALFEDAALVALARGEIDLALVTGAALEGEHWNGAWAATDLGPLVLQLAAGAGHALVAGRRARPDGACHASSAAVLAHDFA